MGTERGLFTAKGSETQRIIITTGSVGILDESEPRCCFLRGDVRKSDVSGAFYWDKYNNVRWEVKNYKTIDAVWVSRVARWDTWTAWSISEYSLEEREIEEFKEAIEEAEKAEEIAKLYKPTVWPFVSEYSFEERQIEEFKIAIEIAELDDVD